MIINKTLNVEICGTGSYIPKKKETIEDFLNKGASSDLIDRWGVFEHRVMAEDETLIDMEVNAAQIAIERAGIRPEEIDLIISGTAVPQQIGVPNSNAIQARINAKKAAAFDIGLACASAIPEIIVGAQFIELKQYRYVLLTGSSHATRFADPSDAASFVVLGDGAGAMILGPSTGESGIISFDIQTRGEYFDYCGFKFKKPKNEFCQNLNYNVEEKLYFYIGDVDISSEVVKDYLVTSVPATVETALGKAGLVPSDIDFMISHQNINTLVGNWVKLLGIPPEKTHLTYAKYGNMTSANIFVNLDEALQQNRIKKGDIVVFAGQGAGFSVGSIVMKW